ncbi:hypothetical protein QYE76_028910 [Lolium multiflorum]|uniref:Uncharacterized protein n=1 Tax=Lolium multiflorum TaxID=4521 RepID=A0AAD8VF08_LOLMU|nr:hypothetical protein QYE76_028910 [Lolium multiflorum]
MKTPTSAPTISSAPSSRAGCFLFDVAPTRCARCMAPVILPRSPGCKKDVVLKARQICQTAMPEDWEWGLRPLGSTNPPTQEAKDRFPGIGIWPARPLERGLDKFDPDPVIHWRDLKMGRTAASRLGKSPPDPAGSSDELTILEAEAGQEFVDKLMAQELMAQGKKNNTPASDAGSSQAPPAKRFRTEPLAAPHSSLAPGLRALPDLQDLNSSSSLKPGTVGAAPPQPPSWEAQQVGRAAYTAITAEEDLSSLPRPKTRRRQHGRRENLPGAEPSVPPVLEKKKRRRPPPRPRRKLPCRQPLHQRRRRKPLFLRQPGPRQRLHQPKDLPARPSRPATLKITDFLKPGRPRMAAPQRLATSSLCMSGLPPLWSGKNLPPPTRGLGKDRLPAPDPAGPRSTEEHFTRLRRAVKEFDSAWYDATSNVVSTADARKALFEELLWEHRDLAEAHSQCQAIPEASIEALKAQVAALQAEKEQLIRDHQKALEAQKEISRELKDQAIQAGVRHVEELKAAESAAEARLNEALEDAGNANVVLQAGLEEATKALKTAEGKAAKAHKAAAEEATRAQKQPGEVARLKAEQKEALSGFPAHAIKKVASTGRGGENLGAPWDPYDHLVALNAGLPHTLGGSEPFRHPRGGLPALQDSGLAKWCPTPSPYQRPLKGACRRIREWRCSAAVRSRLAPALHSWYPELDLDALLGMKALPPIGPGPYRQAAGSRVSYRSTLKCASSSPSRRRQGLSSEEEEDEGEDVPPEALMPALLPQAPASTRCEQCYLLLLAL